MFTLMSCYDVLHKQGSLHKTAALGGDVYNILGCLWQSVKHHGVMKRQPCVAEYVLHRFVR
jgi:hypothetical protein